MQPLSAVNNKTSPPLCGRVEEASPSYKPAMDDHLRIQAHFDNAIDPARTALHPSQWSATCTFEPGQGFLDQEALDNAIFCCPESNSVSSWIEESFMEALDNHSLIRGQTAVGEEFAPDANGIDASDSKDSASLDSLPESPTPPRDSEEKATSQRAHRPRRKCLKGNKAETATDSGISQAREKNRIAADKCRCKKRRAIAQLKTKYETLERTHGQLCRTVSDLVAETHALKNMVMQHGNCDCDLIQKYLKDAAYSWIAKKT